MIEETAKTRALLTQKVRDYFNNKNFIEVETPIMTPHPGMEPHLAPFETHFQTPHTSFPLYLNTSPELQMKKLLGKGFSKIFNITKVFRNGETGGPQHNPEFTMIEWYSKNSDYTNIMEDCENLVTSLAPSTPITYQNTEIDLTTPWPRKSVNELFIEFTKINLLENQTYEEFANTATSHNLDINACCTWDDIFFKIFLNHIEPNLDKSRPLFVYDYPSTQAALARKSPTEPFFAERFELYIAGIELCNAFSELIDPEEQRSRLIEEQKEREKLGKTVFPIDEDFLNHLKSIKEPCAGNALGLDRLFMILMNKKSIEDVLLFPLTKMITIQP